MSTTSRGTLKGYFRKGLRPKESEFGDLIDSFYNINDDPINAGWMFRSVMDDLSRQGDTNLGDGGNFSLNIPIGIKEIRNIRILGQADAVGAPNYILHFRCSYISDIQNAGLENIQAPGFKFPTSTFYHYIVGSLAGHIQIISNGIFDETIPVNLTIQYDQFQYLYFEMFLTNGTFMNGAMPYPVFYGLEFR